MIRLNWVVICVIVVVSTVVLAVSNDAVINKKLMKNFEINWEAMDYDKRVSRYNPKVSSNQQRSRIDL